MYALFSIYRKWWEEAEWKQSFDFKESKVSENIFRVCEVDFLNSKPAGVNVPDPVVVELGSGGVQRQPVCYKLFLHPVPM